MTDLITRLRGLSRHEHDDLTIGDEAADALESLRAELAREHADHQETLRDVDALAGAWGRDDKMAIAAVRYCLGRMTYITADCADWLLDQWPNIRESARAVIRRDIEEAFERDDADRAEGSLYKALGWDCDRRAWERVRGLWAPNVPVKPA